MQKVEGSSPFIRSSRKPRKCGVFTVLGAGRWGAAQGKRAQIGHSRRKYRLCVAVPPGAAVPVGRHIARRATGCLDMALDRRLSFGTRSASSRARTPARRTEGAPEGANAVAE